MNCTGSNFRTYMVRSWGVRILRLIWYTIFMLVYYLFTVQTVGGRVSPNGVWIPCEWTGRLQDCTKNFNTSFTSFWPKFCSVRLSVIRLSIHFSFPDDNLSKYQWIFTKLGMCIDIMEIWFGIANGQISSIFDGVICPRQAHILASGL